MTSFPYLPGPQPKAEEVQPRRPETEATYSLARVHGLVQQRRYRITSTATADAWALGLYESDICQCITALTMNDFYKTMESQGWRGCHQDVYRPTYCGISLYVKVQVVEATAWIVSFKRR